MDDVTKRYLSLQRRLVEEGLDPDYVDLVLHKRSEEIETDADLDSLTNLIVKDTPEKFRAQEAVDGDQEEGGKIYDDLRQQMREKQDQVEVERQARVTAFERLRGGMR